jgi:hypothetical protein
MRTSFAIVATLGLLAAGANAQNQNPPAANGPQNSAINTANSSNQQVTAPVAGRNSFTEGEAKSRIEKMGFTNVSDLKKDDQGVWRGQATKNGQTADVSVDYQGNVVPASPGTASAAARGR